MMTAIYSFDELPDESRETIINKYHQKLYKMGIDDFTINIFPQGAEICIKDVNVVRILQYYNIPIKHKLLKAELYTNASIFTYDNKQNFGHTLYTNNYPCIDKYLHKYLNKVIANIMRDINTMEKLIYKDVYHSLYYADGTYYKQ